MEKSHAYKHASLVFAAVVVGTVVWVNAGPLNPPSGAISPTGRFGLGTEIDQLPFQITMPGRYYLGGNLGGTGSAGIEIQTSNVTVDLNGFLLGGGAGPGIICTGVPLSKNVTIKNGTISGWIGAGVDTTAYSNCRVENLRVSDNGGIGVDVGDHSTVSNCVAKNNARGFALRNGCVISNCTASLHTTAGSGIGFHGIGKGSVFARCVSYDNFEGFSLAGSSSLEMCVARGNANNGIDAGQFSAVRGCVSSDNGAVGIQGTGGVFVENAATGNSTGFNLLSGAVSVNNY